MPNINTEIAAIQEATTGNPMRTPMVRALNTLAGATLPVVSASDAGKVLGVNDSGSWVLVDVENVPVGGSAAEGFELYGATFNGGTQQFPKGVYDNKYLVCCFHDDMNSTYTLNGASGTFSKTEPGRGVGTMYGTTIAVINPQPARMDAMLPDRGSEFTSYHLNSGSYMSVVGGWVGYTTGGTIYENMATGTQNTITMNSAHSKLLVFVGASNNGLGSVSSIDINGVTHSVVNMGARYDNVYSLYTAIEINNNYDTTITVTFPASCYSYLSIICI